MKISLKKNYMLALSLLTIIVAITGIFTIKTSKQELPETKLTTKEEKVVEEPKTEAPEKVEVKEEVKEEIIPQPLEFIMPLKGEIQKDFSDNKLVYSNTLKDFRTHNGIDIKGSILDKVRAVENGKVTKCFNDSLMGNTVIIAHGEGIESIYQNLSTLEMVYEGKDVQKGEIISGIGDTALLETGDEAHLHFEMKENGNTINPLKKINPEA